MFGTSSRSILVLPVLVILIAGCATAPVAPAPTAPPALPATSVPPSPVAPTAAPSATQPSTGALPVTGANSASGTITLAIVPAKSQARYRVREQLARVNFPSDAIGSTNAITGTIVGKPDGTIVPGASKFVVDLTTLKSDQSMRDNFLRQNTLQTNQYPHAIFVPTAATGLPTALPATGQVAFKLTGDLTIRDTTKRVTWDASCQAQSQTEGLCHAVTSFTFGDVGLTIPRVMSVLSIVDLITLELDATLQRVNN